MGAESHEKSFGAWNPLPGVDTPGFMMSARAGLGLIATVVTQW